LKREIYSRHKGQQNNAMMTGYTRMAGKTRLRSVNVKRIKHK